MLSCTVISMRYTRTLMYSYFNLLHAYSRVQLFQCVTRVLSCTVTSMCYTRTLGTVIAMCFSSIKWLHTKQPKLGLTQEFVVDCAHALWVVHTTKRLVIRRSTLFRFRTGFIGINWLQNTSVELQRIIRTIS